MSNNDDLARQRPAGNLSRHPRRTRQANAGEELNQWDYSQGIAYTGGTTRYGSKSWYRKPNFFQQHFPKYFQKNFADFPLPDGDPASQAVLMELKQYPDPKPALDPEWFYTRPPAFKLVAPEALRIIEEKQGKR